MKKTYQKLLALMLSSFVSGLLFTGGFATSARAVDGAPAAQGKAGNLTKIPVRQNNQVDKSETILPANKGVHPFNLVDTTATLVLDETGAAPTAGQLTSVAISSSASAGQCWFQVFDSSTTSGITTTSYSQELGVPLMSASSAAVTVQFSPPIQFDAGLVALMTGTTCNLSQLTWTRIGGGQ